VGDTKPPRVSGEAGRLVVSYVVPRGAASVLAAELAPRRGMLSGEFFANRWLFGTPAALAPSPVRHGLSLDWGHGFLTPTARDFVSARWRGFLTVPYNETFTFTLRVNDGASLVLDGAIIIDALDNVVEAEDAAAPSGASGGGGRGGSLGGDAGVFELTSPHSVFSGPTSASLVADRL
jgi:hypothetical protein